MVKNGLAAKIRELLVCQIFIKGIARHLPSKFNLILVFYEWRCAINKEVGGFRKITITGFVY